MTMRMMTKKKKKPVPKGQEGTPRPVWVPPYQWKCLHCFQMALWVRNLIPPLPSSQLLYAV